MPRSGWLAIGVAGAALVGGIPDATGGWAFVLGGAALLAATSTMPRPAGRIGIPLAVGILACGLRLAVGSTGPTLDGAPEGRGPWTMTVEAVGSPRDGQQVATLRTVSDGAEGFRLAATLPRYPPVEPGDIVIVEGRTRPRPDSPYGAYLERIGAWGNLDASRMSVAPAPTTPVSLLEGIRRDAGAALTVALPEPEAGLAAGILIGLRDRVDRDLAAAFTTAGVSHVVAISGWNIAIVAAAIGAMAGRLGRRRRAVVTVLAITTYVAFAGASPSVLRAGAMAGVVLLARETGRAGYASAALGWAAALLLLADPGLVRDAGFQLSTVATAGLIAWASPLTDRLDRATHGRAPRWLSESLGVSLAAQAATLPIVLASFGRLALIAPIVNLAVVPLVVPAMAAGLLALGGGVLVGLGTPSGVAAILAAPGWVVLRLMVSIVEVAAGLPGASLTTGPAVGGVLALAAVTGIGVVTLARARPAGPRRRGVRAGAAPSGGTSASGRPASPTTSRSSRRARWATLVLVGAIGVTSGVIAMRPAGVVRISVLDVGQGDAILVEGSRGGRLLVDGGPDPDRLLVVLDRRIPPWDRRIDAVVLSHPHEDHVAGLALLLDRYRVGRVFESGMRGPGPGYAAWAERLGRPGAPPRTALAAGDRLRVDDVAIRVLWPDRGTVPEQPPTTGSAINDRSIVLLGEGAGRRFLLTGDLEEGVDPILVARGLATVDVLKVAHHGSRTATTAALLEAAAPGIGIVSVGADNDYGHPTRATLDRLTSTDARVFRTDRDGTVSITFRPDAMTVRREPRPTVGAVDDRSPSRLRYHRGDDGPFAGGGRGPAPLPRPTALGAGARASRGRGRWLAREGGRGTGDRGGPGGGRGGGPAPRRRQAAPGRRPAPHVAPRRGIGDVAHAPRPP